MKDPKWKQETPQQQLAVVTQSIEGWLLVLGIRIEIINQETDPNVKAMHQLKFFNAVQHALETMGKNVQELRELNAWMGKDWEHESSGQSDS